MNLNNFYEDLFQLNKNRSKLTYLKAPSVTFFYTSKNNVDKYATIFFRRSKILQNRGYDEQAY